MLSKVFRSQSDRENMEVIETLNGAAIENDNIEENGGEHQSVEEKKSVTILEEEKVDTEGMPKDDEQIESKDIIRKNSERLARSLRINRRLKTVTSYHDRSNKPKKMHAVSKFWIRMIDPNYKKTKDPYHDEHETHRSVLEVDIPDIAEKEIYIPKLKDCRESLHNQEKEDHRNRASNPLYRARNTLLGIFAAFYIYLVNTFGFETLIVIINALSATIFFCENAYKYATRLDFSFLAFSIIFPLTFLIQSTFSRRDQALSRLADYRACILSTALYTLTVDWPSTKIKGSTTGGRLDLPESFDEAVVSDCRQLVKLSYEYLSMPSVAHARHIVFNCDRKAAKRVHAMQNNVVKQINDLMFDFYLHTEIMRKHGFPSGEASRLTQFHQYLQQRFDQLRFLKYYRTPQATRSFGRVFIFFLPWLNGPYFASVYESTNYVFVILLSAFTYLVLLGLLNTQMGLEDPFISDFTSWTPGIDTVKLDYELAVTLQALEQYFAHSKIQRNWNISQSKRLRQHHNSM